MGTRMLVGTEGKGRTFGMMALDDSLE